MNLIYDNIIFNLQNAGGISTYWGELIKRHLINENVDIKFINYKNENLVSSIIEFTSESILNKDSDYVFMKRFFDINLNNFKDNFIFHSSYNRKASSKVKNVCTVHDFIHEKYYTGPRNWIHKYQKTSVIKSADFIIAISENTKKDLLYYHPYLDEKKIKVIYNGVSDDFFLLDGGHSQLQYLPFFLFIGSRASYKNFNFAINAVSQTKDFVLRIVGSSLNKNELSILNELIPNRWVLHENVDNEKLNILYNNAFALIYPSYYEGFGIPIVEAMKSGCPFIALNSSSIPEVAGDAGILIDKLEMSSFINAVSEIKNNREEIVRKGIIQSNKYSWQRCYEETTKVYNEMYK